VQDGKGGIKEKKTSLAVGRGLQVIATSSSSKDIRRHKQTEWIGAHPLGIAEGGGVVGNSLF